MIGFREESFHPQAFKFIVHLGDCSKLHKIKKWMCR